MQAGLLTLSLAALAAGPAAFWLGRRSGSALSFIDGFNLVAVAGLVLLHALPDAFVHAGWPAVLLGAAAFFGPTWIEQRARRAASGAHAAATSLALLGLVVHALLDGAAIASGNDMLAIAVVLHRLPLSITICLLFAKGQGLRVISMLAGLAVATVLGFLFGGPLLATRSLYLGLFEGLVAGALLHVVVHQPPLPGGTTPTRWVQGAGALLGIGLVYAAGRLEGHHADAIVTAHTQAWRVLVQLAGESAPALLIAYLGAGLLDVFMPRATVRWMQRGPSIVQALRGVAFGLPLPICSCGVIPLYRGLVLKGAPLSAALAFLVATPEIGIDAVLLSLPLLGPQLTVVRVAAAALIAVLSGWAVEKLGTPETAPQRASVADDAARPAESGAVRLRRALQAGLADMVDNTAPWILLGLAIAAVGARALDAAWLSQAAGADVIVFALLGIPIYVCASGATPLVTMLIYKGVSPGAAIAFLLTGPATNATTFGVLSRLHGQRTALTFGLLVASCAIVLGFAINAAPITPHVFSLTGHQHGGLGPLRLTALLVLTAVFGASLLRQGPRRFAAHVLSNADGEEAHVHTHAHDHCH